MIIYILRDFQVRKVLIFVVLFVFFLGCKKDISKNEVLGTLDLTGIWQSYYLNSNLILEIKEDSTYAIKLPFALKKDANSPSVRGFLYISGHYHRSLSGGILAVDSLKLLNVTSSLTVITVQQARQLLNNIYTVVHKTDSKLSTTDSLVITWENNRLNF